MTDELHLLDGPHPQACAPAPIATILDIADIVTRSDWQVRAQIDPGIVRSYATVTRTGGTLPPIQVARINGALYLVDGWHRLEAAKLNGEAFICAEVADMSEEEAQWAAARANLSHGLPLKPREVRTVFRAYVRSRQHRDGRRFKSYREIAADHANRVGHTTIRNWMRQDFPSVFRAMGEDSGRPDGGEAQGIPVITALARAKASLDQAAAEARALNEEDRRELLRHLREIEAKIPDGRPWEPAEDGAEDGKPDF